MTRSLSAIALTGLLVVAALNLFVPALPANAQPVVTRPSNTSNCPQSNPNCNSGDYTFDEMIAILPRIAQIILGLSGSLALFAFIWGGVMLLVSGGSREKVEQGKNIIKAAVIGILIVFLSYSIMAYVYSLLGLTFNG